MRVALFPGSFDPFTLGHLDLVRRARPLFERVVVAVGHNRQKAGFLPVDERCALVAEALREAGVDGVEVRDFQGLTVDFAVEVGAGWLLRGVRGASDLDVETSMAGTNQAVEPGLETLFLPASPALAHVHARWVREMAAAGRDVRALVPPCVHRALGARGPGADPSSPSPERDSR